ncbi:hypothetical protein BV898_15510 [Hypsibius exemplaris]|uniref:Uncharacterized protein n=1 Tax=Hypsibius exemplaris TaxID=2072580 RepID=A0A9X6RKK4_HYPEX|nr:hypothetical protein BV898_15510 [Hypsibius exemplaris]
MTAVMRYAFLLLCFITLVIYVQSREVVRQQKAAKTVNQARNVVAKPAVKRQEVAKKKAVAKIIIIFRFVLIQIVFAFCKVLFLFLIIVIQILLLF